MSSLPMSRSAVAPRLAIPPSRLFVLLFLSTEVMFFAGLIAVYLILRISSGPLWPTPADVHVHLWVGLVNTLILLASSWTMTQTVSAVGRSQPGRAKSYLWATIALGSIFLAIKGGEYAVKVRHGLYPQQPELAVFSAPDLEYLGSLNRQLSRQRTALVLRTTADPAAATQIERLDRIKLGLVDWTGRVLLQSNNPFRQALALQSLAYVIEPTRATAPGTMAYLQTEINTILPERQELQEEKARLQVQLDQLLGSLTTVGGQAADSPAAQQNGSEVQAAVTAARERLTAVNTRLGAIDDRMWVLHQVGLDLDRPAPEPTKLDEGLNQRLGVRLPYVLPGANRWIAGYWLLTGFHALHLLGGLLVMGILALRRLTIQQFNFAHNLGTYWHFVDAVWLVVFVLVYVW